MDIDRDSEDFAREWCRALEFAERTPSEDAVDLAFQLLADLDLEDVQRAIAIHLADTKRGHYPIKPADVRRIVEGDPDAAAEHAWSRLIWAIEKIGPYKSVAFDDPILQGLAHEMGGWAKLNSMNEEEFKYLRHGFIRSYSGYLQRRSTPPETGVLRNLFGGMEKGGEHIELLGDPEKARAIAKLPVNGEHRETVRMADLRGEEPPEDEAPQIAPVPSGG